MNIGQAVMKYEQDIIRELSHLIGIRSVKEPAKPGMPYGPGVARALNYMLQLGEALGFKSCNVDGYAGHIEWSGGNEIVAVLVHLDTVPEGDGWRGDPLVAEINGDLLTGRGASDDKGPAVAALYALAALRDAIDKPERTIRIIFGTDEENGMTDMDYYFSKQPLPDYAFTPDAAYPIIHAEKGFLVNTLHEARDKSSQSPVIALHGGEAANMVPDYCEATLDGKRLSKAMILKLEKLVAEKENVKLIHENGVLILQVKGKSGHGAYPPSGINAVILTLELLFGADLLQPYDELLYHLYEHIGFEAFGESLGIACEHPKHGKLTVNLAAVKLDQNQASAVLNIRYPVVADGAQLLQQLEQRFAERGIQFLTEQHMEPLYIEEDHPLIQKLGYAYELIMNEPAKLLSIGGGTYARKLQNRGVAFGAGFPGRNHGPGAHQPNECISLSDLMLHAQICTQALYELQKKGDEQDDRSESDQ